MRGSETLEKQPPGVMTIFRFWGIPKVPKLSCLTFLEAGKLGGGKMGRSKVFLLGTEKSPLEF